MTKSEGSNNGQRDERMATTTMEADITKALQKTLTARIGELLAEEIKKAKEHIERRIREEADKMALDILNFYSIERNQQNIIITVKKP